AVAVERGSTPQYKLNEIDFPAHSARLSNRLEAYLNSTRQTTLNSPFTETGAIFPHSYCGADTSHMGVAGIPSVLVGPTGPMATPGRGDDAVFLSEVLDTATFLQGIGTGFDWSHL